MACGTPVVASTTPALKEVLGDVACFVDSQDAPGLARMLTELAADDERREQLSAVGIKHAAHYTWRRAAEQTLSVYHRAAGA
jgi:glycosyltransferase involved in cell wall biosynthesis